MIEVIDNLWVGSDKDVPEAQKRHMAIAAMCKEGPYGHRAALGYKTLGAPHDKNYYSYEKGSNLYVNLIDSEDPNFIPEEAIDAALTFIGKHMANGNKVLVHCNEGHSRGPTTALMYLRSIGEMPHNFLTSEKVYRTLYAKYDPAQGIRQYARSHWSALEPQGE